MVRKKTKNNHSSIERKHLSIRISSGGFSFCVKEIDTRKVLDISEVSFEKGEVLPVQHLEKFKEFFEKESLFQNDYELVTVTHYNRLVTQVPLPFFKEESCKDYLQYTVKVLEDDYVTFDQVTNTELVNVYIPFVHINNFLLDIYGSFTFKHSATVLIENLRHYGKDNQCYYFVNVHKDSMEVVVFQNHQLALYNVFSYETEEDFIYYILFVAEQLEISPEEFSLILLGEIEEESPYYKIVAEYVRNVSLYGSVELKNERFAPHRYFTLLHS
ncbi:MAG: DUF3822 family protein [Flavobacteriaceae bacterium]|nr:DUF3822 family protein [Flavobacteriaceae bacterium]